jgi:hypothetical protein
MLSAGEHCHRDVVIGMINRTEFTSHTRDCHVGTIAMIEGVER